MNTRKKQLETVDEYIKTFPEDVQRILEEMRRTIRDAAPGAVETMSYQMPTFKLNGNAVHFAAWKNHIGFYGIPSGNGGFEKELSSYKSGKGSIQFPIDEPIPYDLVRKIAVLRLKEKLEGKK